MNFLSQQSTGQFFGKRVIVRVDVNVPVTDGMVSDREAFRIHAMVPTISWLREAGAKIILIAHIGRSGDSLKPVFDYLNHQFPEWNSSFAPEIFGETTKQMIDGMSPRDCVLLENLRMDTREELNDPDFARALADYGDYFVNDAFGVCHREHASVVGISGIIPSFAGTVIEQEIHHLGQVLQPEHPAVLVMAGIKFETKLPLIQKLLPAYEYVILGGGLLNTYLAQMHYQIGTSVFDDQADLRPLLGNQKILLPESVIVERDGVGNQVFLSDVTPSDIIVDIVLTDMMRQVITSAQTVVWNGPLGWYEKGYIQSSLDLVSAINPRAQSIVGGGDTVTLLAQQGASDKVSFLSTGGGAMLEYLEKGTLPGLRALE